MMGREETKGERRNTPSAVNGHPEFSQKVNRRRLPVLKERETLGCRKREGDRTIWAEHHPAGRQAMRWGGDDGGSGVERTRGGPTPIAAQWKGDSLPRGEEELFIIDYWRGGGLVPKERGNRTAIGSERKKYEYISHREGSDPSWEEGSIAVALWGRSC